MGLRWRRKPLRKTHAEDNHGVHSARSAFTADMKVTLIAAHSENLVLAREGRIPWHLPDDIAHFRACCVGKWLLAGRRTWEQMREWFQPGQTPVVVTRDVSLAVPGGFAVTGVTEGLALAEAGGAPECMIIGGGQIYAAALPRAGELILTEVHASVPGDVFFPALRPDEWREVERHPHPADSRHAYAFTIRRLVRLLH
jgi:dihydrofolate reductase